MSTASKKIFSPLLAAPEHPGFLIGSHFQFLRVFFVLAMVALPFPAFAGLSFDGANQYVTFGAAKNLGSPEFTLEAWFFWTGGGVAANTGNGGLTAIPLLAKLCAEQDGDQRDGNYFIGIRVPQGVLAADFEEGAAGVLPGANHPVSGVTVIRPRTWHHAAVSYNGTKWSLFLDGNLETTLAVGQPPRSDSIQHAALATALNSTGVPQGYFAGILDEVRIWSYARSASQIASNKNLQIRSETGLLGRWSLEETNGLLAQDSSGHGVQGTLINGPRWVADDRAPADVLTPIKLSVIDPERTELLRQSESKRVPPVFRHDPAIADQVEKGFRASLQTNKTFLAHPKSSQGIVSLREVMTRYLCPEVLPAEARLGPPNVRFYTRGFGSPSPDLELLESQSQSCSRTNLWPVGKARADLRRHFSTNDEALANYVATFVRENCIFDAELTRQSRLRQAESLFAADHYQPGQLIVQKGQIIDGRIRAALDELKAQIAADERNARAAVKQIRTEAELKDLQQRAALSEFKSKLFSEQNRWLLGGLIAVAITSSLTVWQLSRSRRGQILPPVPLLSASASEGGDLAAWRERALHAEERATQASTVIRAGLLPHLAQWLKEKLVRRLVAERSHLLSAQEKAELDLAELEARLARVHAPMEERLHQYRQRIVDLERELEVKGQENRELIQAKIELTRKRLEEENSKSG